MPPPQLTALEQQQLTVAAASGDTFWHRVRFRLVAQAVARSGANTVLDIGAGSGQLGQWLGLRSNPPRYLFQETSPLLDAALAAKFGAEHRGAEDATIASTTLVALLDVLEHIEHDEIALRAIGARMVPGAQLLVTVPAFQRLFTSWDDSLGHFRRYTRGEILRLADRAGFTVLSSAYIFPELLPLVLLRKLRRSERSAAEFPSLPRVIDRTAEACSRATTALRRLWPAGTSVVALLTPKAASSAPPERQG
ncbi:MAG: class I SAM-dependent methyltransferase [Actinobacteria bacterium]|nr:class I SAM-dependent methyltransferase [Actinomycetota bacterium]